ncbi:transglutaminase domain-containing protein [Parahaliea aestuarii]|uniref:Tetratricopeptide repeat protein n=1 Tax=Parahaliea aestuarii TaxID=1852021 RepID=A0A5C8ZNB7_9GAMM|nr:transglutaminase domain-containing protein [Parahaliea aestuarii]TXS89129.1 tetratricopeptide repeat protein [Parahaliea aestuarii]
MAGPVRGAGLWRWCGSRRRCFVVFLFPVFLLTACSHQPSFRDAVTALPPLQFEGQVVTLEAAASLDSPGLLDLDEAMRDFVASYARSAAQPRQRLINLHSAVKGSGTLGMRYDAFSDGTAQQVFQRGTANCLSYAHLFVALAREAGLDARYQWLEVRPQWTRIGERVALRLHVNVLVRLPSGEQYMVDIDPLPSRDIADSRTLSDGEARALHHNNLAMEALATGDLAAAWQQGVKALQISPDMGQLWVNLGAIYRAAGQDGPAERSYFRALQLDGGDRSAMNNLLVLYQRQGRSDEQAYWAERVARYREANPYYHAWLGDQAGEAGDWDAALLHYQRALDLRGDDARLFYALGIIEYRRGDYDAATDYIGRAIKGATLRGDIDDYRLQLDLIRREALAAR